MDIDSQHQITEEEQKSKLTIFIVDNQPLYRQAIHQVLTEDMEVVGESPLTADVWIPIESLLPDIVLVDVGLPLYSGFGVARQIVRHCPKVAVVMISPSPDDDQLFRAIKIGAFAFLSKDAGASEVASILRKVGQGQYPINDSLLNRPNIAEKILQLFHNLSLMGNDVDSLLTPLSRRETEVLKHIAEGNSNKLIAYTLGVGEQTIKNYVASIMRKLNANDRTHAVVLAIRSGWLNVGELSDLPIVEMVSSHQN